MDRASELADKISEEGFTDIGEFVKTNLHYLSEEKQRLFYSLDSLQQSFHKSRNESAHSSTSVKYS
tara:strand:+ start:2098 stop:2295 length:198 start_codon:yes stop_codon:yes gene_type:complete